MILVVSLALVVPAGAGAPVVPSVPPPTWARWTVDSTQNAGEYSAFALSASNQPSFAYSVGTSPNHQALRRGGHTRWVRQHLTVLPVRHDRDLGLS
jgi:hypothetical protein